MRRLANTLFLGPTLLLFGLFFILPMGMLVIFSFQGADGFTQTITFRFWQTPLFQILWNSFWFSVVVTAGTLVLSGLIAFFLARTEFKGKNLYMTLITFPASLPGVVVGFMIIVLFGNIGVVPMLTRQITGKAIGSFAYTITGIFFAYLYFMIPKIVMTVHGAGVEFDRRLEEAARQWSQ